MNGNERSVQKMNGNERNILNGNERDAQPWVFVLCFHFRLLKMNINERIVLLGFISRQKLEK